MELRIGRRLRQAVPSTEEASRIYGTVRDASGEGGSTFPDGWIYESGKKAYHVTYNGRVWTTEPWPDATLIHEAVR